MEKIHLYYLLFIIYHSLFYTEFSCRTLKLGLGLETETGTQAVTSK